MKPMLGVMDRRGDTMLSLSYRAATGVTRCRRLRQRRGQQGQARLRGFGERQSTADADVLNVRKASPRDRGILLHPLGEVEGYE